MNELISFIGLTPEEAEQLAAESGVTIRFQDVVPPTWLVEEGQRRVGRQRIAEDGSVELLTVLVPVIAVEPAETDSAAEE